MYTLELLDWVAQFEIPPQHLPRGTKENNGKLDQVN
jgi:hypothetical protein